MKNIFPGGAVANLSLSGKPTQNNIVGAEVNAVERVPGSDLCPDDPLGPFLTSSAEATFHVTDESGNVLLDQTKTVECISGVDNPSKFIVTFGLENCGPGGNNVGVFDIVTTVSGEVGNASRTQRIRCRP